MPSDDERLARASKLLRRRENLRQADVTAPGRSRRFVIRLETDGASDLRLGDVRDHFKALGARLRMTVWAGGAAIDRLFDERHAALVERALRYLRARGWRTEVEVSFSVYGERGSIDLLAGHDPTRSLFVGEVKSDIGSLEETNRVFDAKVRLAPDVAVERFGWRASAVGKALILPEDWTLRRLVRRHQATIASAYPDRGREVRRWVRRPSGPLRGLWFLSEVHRPAHEDRR